MRRSVTWLICLILFSLSSCDNQRVLEEYAALENSTWEYEEAVAFETEIKDTSATYNLLVNVRHNGLYSYQNLWVMVAIEGPDGKPTLKRKELILAEKDGRWIGSGLGDLLDVQETVLKHFKIKEAGVYKLAIRHDMRINSVQNVEAVGIRLEKASN